MPNPTKPHVVTIKGSSASVEGDIVRLTVYTGSTARGTTTVVLDSNKKAIMDLQEISTSYSAGDTIEAVEYGSSLGGSSATVSGQGSDISITATAIALPSISL